jgi:hypothetical protein
MTKAITSHSQAVQWCRIKTTVEMKPLILFFMSFALVMPGATLAQRRGDQDVAYEGRRAGALRPLRSIEDSIVPREKARGADYIGPEFDSEAGRYRLKFVRGGSVIWVDVDGRTGAVVGRAGD